MSGARKSSLEVEIDQVSGFAKLKRLIDPPSIASELSKDSRNALLKTIWTEQLIPQWDKVKYTRKAYRTLWYGVPSRIRGEVWQIIAGNELKITVEQYKALVKKGISNYASDEKSNLDKGYNVIMLDLPRTFPDLMFFHEEGPLREPLKEILFAWACFRPDIGYVQGMSYLAAMLLLNLPSTEASFIAFCNILNKDLFFSLYQMDAASMKRHVCVYDDMFASQLPKLYKKFAELELTADMYIFEWMITIFSRSIPLDVSSRIWDNFLYYGPFFIFRTSLGIVRYYQDQFLSEDYGFDEILQTLNRPKNIEEDALFDSIEKISLTEKDYEDLVYKYSP